MQRNQRNLLSMIIGVCINGLLLATLTAAFHNKSFVKFDDVEIQFNETIWKCDKILCPIEADRCHVSKENSPHSPSLLVRKNICYSKDGTVLLEGDTEEPNYPKQRISLKIDTYRSGATSLNDNSNSIDQVEQSAGDYIRKVNQEIAQQMKDLRQQMSSSFFQ